MSDELRAKAFRLDVNEGHKTPLVVELSVAEAKLAECEAKLQQFAADTVEGMECLPTCDSTAHDELCPVAHPVEAWRVLRERLAEYEQEIEQRQETEQSLTNWVGTDGELIADLERKLAEYEGKNEKD